MLFFFIENLKQFFNCLCVEYFSKWRLEARARDDYDEKMLLTPSTEEGILCTSFSMAGLIADTLQDGAQYVITRRCNQGFIFDFAFFYII